MFRFRTVQTRSPGGLARCPTMLRSAMLAAVTGACGSSMAEPVVQLVDETRRARGGTLEAAMPAGRGLQAWTLRSNYSPAPVAGSGQLELLMAPMRNQVARAALTQFDAGQHDDSLRFGMASALAGQRLVLSGGLHARRHQNVLGSQVLPGKPYRIFGDVVLAYRVRHDLSIGAEYRFDPDNSQSAGPFGSRAREGAWKDLFISWSLGSSVVLTAAYVDLGSLVRVPSVGRQTGQYVSAEFRY